MSENIILPLEVTDICEILPHRAPFLMLDRILEFQDGESIVGQKNVSINEPYFAGHFPERPTMPGVLIVEALAQLGVMFAKLSTGGCPPEKLLVFSGIESCRFKRQVFPGDVLILRLNNFKRKRTHWKMEGEACVGEEIAARCTISASEVEM